VTNIIFIFETFPNTKPKDKKRGNIAYYVPPVWKSGGTCPPCPPPNCAHAFNDKNILLYLLRAGLLHQHFSQNFIYGFEDSLCEIIWS